MAWANFAALVLAASAFFLSALFELLGFSFVSKKTRKFALAADTLGRVDTPGSKASDLILYVFHHHKLPANIMALEFHDTIKVVRAEFEAGAEDENNWQRRNTLCRRLGDLCEKHKHDAPRDIYDQLKPLLQIILTTCTTERTTLGISAMACLSAIFNLLGSQISPQIDHMAPTLISLSGVTKKLTSKCAGSAMDTLVVTAGYSSRLTSHVCDAFKEKATSTRLFAVGWLTQIILLYGRHLDSVRDFPKIARALTDGLSDSQNTVREAIRPTYWKYAQLPGTDALAIMDRLAKDKAAALKNHPDNPDRPAGAGKPARPASALAQMKARSKATLKQSTTAKPAVDTPDARSEPSKSNDMNTSTSSATARKPAPIGTMAAAPARMPAPMGRSTTAPHGVAKRDMTQSSHSTDHNTGHIDPDAVMVPLPSSPRDATFADSESRSAAAKKKVRHGPEHGHRHELSTSEKNLSEDALLKHHASKNPERVAAVDRNTRDESGKAKHVDNASLRSLMSAPVRRPRIVATPMNQSQPPVRPSSRDEPKKVMHTGRQTPTEEPIARGHKKQASSRSGRHTPTIREDTGHQKKPSVSRAKTAPAPVPTSRPTSSSSSSKLRLEASSDPITHTPPTAPKSDTPPEDIESVQDLEPVKTVTTPRVIDGKENTFTHTDGCSHKKAYEACTTRVKDARSDVQRLKDALKAGKLDALGHKKLSGMLKDKPGQLVTSQADFDELYIVLVNALTANANIIAPPGNSAKNPGHPFYNRHALIDCITRLLQQFPDAGEPSPGMALMAVIKCNATHPGGERFRVASTIEDAAFTLVRLTSDANLLAAIDNVADSLIETQLRGQADASTFSLGLRSLSALLTKAATSGKQLFDVQERLVAEVATAAIASFRGECGREILGFVAALKGLISPEERVVALFEREDDRNLVMYYLGK